MMIFKYYKVIFLFSTIVVSGCFNQNKKIIQNVVNINSDTLMVGFIGDNKLNDVIVYGNVIEENSLFNNYNYNYNYDSIVRYPTGTKTNFMNLFTPKMINFRIDYLDDQCLITNNAGNVTRYNFDRKKEIHINDVIVEVTKCTETPLYGTSMSSCFWVKEFGIIIIYDYITRIHTELYSSHRSNKLQVIYDSIMSDTNFYYSFNYGNDSILKKLNDNPNLKYHDIVDVSPED